MIFHPAGSTHTRFLLFIRKRRLFFEEFESKFMWLLRWLQVTAAIDSFRIDTISGIIQDTVLITCPHSGQSEQLALLAPVGGPLGGKYT